MRNSERRKSLRVFLRVGVFSIALGLSAAALIRTFAVLREVSVVQQRLTAARATGEELGRKNDELMRLSGLRTQLLRSTGWNADYVTRYYQYCRDSSDLPQIKTDFIIHDDASFASGQTKMAFSVPEGAHALQLSIEAGTGTSWTGGETTKIDLPLLASSGYLVHIHAIAADVAGQRASFSIELTGNHADFAPVKATLPIPHSERSALLPEVMDVLADQLTARLKGRRILNNQGKDLQPGYPNSLYLIDGNTLELGPSQGFVLASCYIESDNIPMRVSLSIISDAPDSVSAEIASKLKGRLRTHLEPYKGNGRFYVAPDPSDTKR